MSETKEEQQLRLEKLGEQLYNANQYGKRYGIRMEVAESHAIEQLGRADAEEFLAVLDRYKRLVEDWIYILGQLEQGSR